MIRTLLALGAFFVLVVTLAACGGGVPGDAVARVGDAVIKTSTFDHWLRIVAKSSQPGGANLQPPDPPNFTRCIAQKRNSAPVPTKGQAAPTSTQFKSQCKQEYEGMRDQALQFLIRNEWLEGEADDLGVEISDAQLNQELERQRKQAFPKPADFQRFLKNTGETRDDVLQRVKSDFLTRKITEKITKGTDKVSNAEITSYYAKNKKRFGQPEQRDLLVVLTKTKAKADQANAALASGQAFKAVAKKYSIDQASKAQGGKLLAVTKGQQERALDRAVFSARKNELRGPVKTQFGYYVFKVTKVTKAKQQTLAESRETIRQVLRSQKQQKALETFSKKFEKKWKGRTNCRKGFIVQMCKNAPKPKAASTVPPGAVPQTGQTTPQTTTPTQP